MIYTKKSVPVFLKEATDASSIITVTVFLMLLRLLCKRPLMGRMLKDELKIPRLK